MQGARGKATYDDLRSLPDGTFAELIAGHIVTTPSALPEHGRAQSVLSRHIGGPFDDDDDRGGPGGWWIIPEVDVRLDGENVVRPDVSGWQRVRLPSPWGRLPIDVVPDWICEIVSPSSAARDRVTKRELYHRAGVVHYWILDPAARVLEALQRSEDRWVELGVYGEENLASIPPFDAIELEVSRLFPPSASDPP